MGSTDCSKTIAVLEAVSAGFLSCDDPEATAESHLIAEGAAMLSAICESIVEVGGRVETLLDGRFRDRFKLPPPVVVHELQSIGERSLLDGGQTFYGTNWGQVRRGLDRWMPIAQHASASVVVAPESDGLLEHILDRRGIGGRSTFNCSSDFVRFASDKWRVAEFCREHDIPHPQTWLLSDYLRTRPTSADTGAWCLKPRDGVGCLGLRKFDDVRALSDFFGRDRAADDRWIVQRWVGGTPVSRGYIAGELGLLPAAWMRQDLRSEVDAGAAAHTYSFVAGHRLEQEPPEEAVSIERRLMDLLRRHFAPSLHGWIGIDYVLGSDAQLTLIEINPRLTTTFSAVGNEPARTRFAESVLRLGERRHRETDNGV